MTYTNSDQVDNTQSNEETPSPVDTAQTDVENSAQDVTRAPGRYYDVRIVSNNRLTSINPPLNSGLEMPKPPFEDGHGWFYPKSHNNKKHSGIQSGFTDLNNSSCTNGTSKWYFRYMFDESEYEYSNWEKPKEWSPQNFKMNDCVISGTASGNSYSNSGLHAKNVFKVGRSPMGNDVFQPYYRTNNNLSKRFAWCVMEGAKFEKNQYVQYLGTDVEKAHHVRATAITFRYKVHLQEDHQNAIGALRDIHGCNPIESFALAYVKKGDNDIRLAECIAVPQKWLNDDAPWPQGRQNSSSGIWFANYKMRNGDWNKSTATRGLQVWADNGYKDNPGWQPNVDGVCTLAVSKKAAEKIWDENYVCIGFASTAIHSSRQAFMTGSSCWFRMFDVKLLEMERRGQNDFDGDGGEDTPKYARILRPEATKNQNHDYYNSEPDYIPLDLI